MQNHATVSDDLGELTYAKKAHRLERPCFLHMQYLENEATLSAENYGTLLNIPEQNCMQNLEHF